MFVIIWYMPHLLESADSHSCMKITCWRSVVWGTPDILRQLALFFLNQGSGRKDSPIRLSQVEGSGRWMRNRSGHKTASKKTTRQKLAGQKKHSRWYTKGNKMQEHFSEDILATRGREGDTRERGDNETQVRHTGVTYGLIKRWEKQGEEVKMATSQERTRLSK